MVVRDDADEYQVDPYLPPMENVVWLRMPTCDHHDPRARGRCGCLGDDVHHHHRVVVGGRVTATNRLEKDGTNHNYSILLLCRDAIPEVEEYSQRPTEFQKSQRVGSWRFGRSQHTNFWNVCVE
jgi:hypothetical protein